MKIEVDMSLLVTAERLSAQIADEARAAAAVEARTYLSSTDWYVVRRAETGEEIPDEISALRFAARATINAAMEV